MLEQTGIAALAIHCRTRDQGHEGLVSWEYIEQIKNVISIPVILNGDVKTCYDVKRAFEVGADAVMIGRAAITNPWIFREAHHYLKTGEIHTPPTLLERIKVSLEHLRHNLEFKGDKYGILEIRKFWGGYLHGLPLASLVRKDIIVMETYDEIEARLMKYPQEVEDFLKLKDAYQKHESEIV